MKNKLDIKGDGNFVAQGVKNSKINFQNISKTKEGKTSYGFLGLVIALLTLIATLIVGWDNIINFFTK